MTPKLDKTMICKFWLKGRCSRSEGCKFAHGEAEQRAACAAVPCRYYSLGNCRQGEACWFAHSSTSKSSNPEGETIAENIRPGGNADARPKLQLRDDSASASAPSLSSQAASGSSGAAPSASDKTLMCKFWRRNRCARKEDCKFAHGEEEQRQACKAVMCRFIQAGSCSQGSACWYAHSEAELVAPPGARAKQSSTSVSEFASPAATAKRQHRGIDDGLASPCRSVTSVPVIDTGESRRLWADIGSEDDDDSRSLQFDFGVTAAR